MLIKIIMGVWIMFGNSFSVSIEFCFVFLKTRVIFNNS